MSEQRNGFAEIIKLKNMIMEDLQDLEDDPVLTTVVCSLIKEHGIEGAKIFITLNRKIIKNMYDCAMISTNKKIKAKKVIRDEINANLNLEFDNLSLEIEKEKTKQMQEKTKQEQYKVEQRKYEYEILKLQMTK